MELYNLLCQEEALRPNLSRLSCGRQDTPKGAGWFTELPPALALSTLAYTLLILGLRFLA